MEILHRREAVYPRKVVPMRISRLLLLIPLVLAIPATLFAQLSVTVNIAPPELVAYSQPSCPQSGYLWTPGYWAYGSEGYYWVPGTWVQPPAVGVLWTPGYWGWGSGGYVWNAGYWGPTVGFYGGINYGFGYSGVGYGGGYWNNGAFYYNQSVNNVNVAVIHNTYVRSFPRAGGYVSYNGGRGGTIVRPTAAQEAAARGRHYPATAAQAEHLRAAGRNHELLASVNHGKPPIAATSRPGEFTGRGVIAARGAAVAARASETRPTTERATATHPSESKTTEKRAAATHPAESRATEKRAAATRASETRPMTERAAATRASETRPTTERATATHPSESKTTEKRAAATRPSESRPTTEKAAASHPSESKTTEKTAAPTRPSENKETTERAAASHTSENKSAEKPVAARSDENKSHSQPVATRQHEEPATQARAESVPEKKSSRDEVQPRQ